MSVKIIYDWNLQMQMEVKIIKIIFQLAHYVHVLTDQWFSFFLQWAVLKYEKFSLMFPNIVLHSFGFSVTETKYWLQCECE